MPQISEEKLKKIRKVESSINKHLFAICIAITLIAMIMLTIEFFSRGGFPPSEISFFYMGVLFIYSIHKEMLRWLGEKEKERQGELFVYAWIGFTVVFYTINFFSKGYFNYSSEGVVLGSLNEIAITALGVCGIFILTRLSKLLKIILEKR